MWLTFEAQECILNACNTGDLIHNAAWGIEEIILNPLTEAGHGHRFHLGTRGSANSAHRGDFDSSAAGNAGPNGDVR
jgi:hypothetical protein